MCLSGVCYRSAINHSSTFWIFITCLSAIKKPALVGVSAAYISRISSGRNYSSSNVPPPPSSSPAVGPPAVRGGAGSTVINILSDTVLPVESVTVALTV
jgi:hypothetical protein